MSISVSAYLHGFDLGPTSQWIVWLIRYGWKLVYIQLWYCWGEISRYECLIWLLAAAAAMLVVV